MRYKVNEIFYSLQGEGFWTGTPMVFVRFSGCNLRCPFCDTSHAAFMEMSADEILSAVRAAGGECRRICLTGGEPSLQLDEPLVRLLKAEGYALHIETNGTRELPEELDWITLSPKSAIVLQQADELKLVLAPGVNPAKWSDFNTPNLFLQPCDDNGRTNVAEVKDYILAHPQWRLSLQTHKLLGIR
ncbi:MAG: radical SAM protein [Bacteroidales bacterium]|nr:radical SAM protein [Bacteroidales bacterium]